MANRRTAEEQLANLIKKEDELKKRKKALVARVSADERKKRNHRLIQIGAELEKQCGEIKYLDAWVKYVSQYSSAIIRSQKDFENNIKKAD